MAIIPTNKPLYLSKGQNYLLVLKVGVSSTHEIAHHDDLISMFQRSLIPRKSILITPDVMEIRIPLEQY